MVKWSTVTIATAIIYLVPIKYIITTIVDYYKSKPATLKKKTAIVVMDKIGMNFERAREYGKQKCKIVIASRNMKKAEQAKKELIQITKNKNMTVVELNCSKKENLIKFAENICQTHGSIDILVNNDGFEITDMDLNFSKQELAKERLVTHCCTFLWEDEDHILCDVV